MHRGVDKFARGWDVVKRVYANNWIFSPQTTMYSNIMNLKNWGGLSPLAPPLSTPLMQRVGMYCMQRCRDVLHAEMYYVVYAGVHIDQPCPISGMC